MEIFASGCAVVLDCDRCLFSLQTLAVELMVGHVYPRKLSLNGVGEPSDVAVYLVLLEKADGFSFGSLQPVRIAQLR